MGMLTDFRMDRYDEAMDYLMGVTNSITEDDIIPLLRGKSPEELIEINKIVGSYLTPQFFESSESSLTVEAYKEYGKYKGD
jgi:hypothetical protein